MGSQYNTLPAPFPANHHGVQRARDQLPQWGGAGLIPDDGRAVSNGSMWPPFPLLKKAMWEFDAYYRKKRASGS